MSNKYMQYYIVLKYIKIPKISKINIMEFFEWFFFRKLVFSKSTRLTTFFNNFTGKIAAYFHRKTCKRCQQRYNKGK